MKRRIFFDAGAPGGGGGGKPESEQELLLKKINSDVKSELEKRGYQNKTEVEGLITETLKGLDLEALRKFDSKSIEQSVKNLATEFEKIKNTQERRGGQLQAIREALANEEFMATVEDVYRGRKKGVSVELNTRAAVNITTATGVDDGDIPEDILNSFSIDTFVKKRRPSEYIFDVVSRRQVSNITEYKTWLEEGDEQGSFAIVSQGAVKPLVSKKLVRNESKYKKIAGKRVYTEEFAKFRKEAYGIIEELFNDQMLRNYAAGLVTDLEAIAASYVGTSLDDSIASPNEYHAIGAVAAQIEALDFMPDLLVLNPQDKWKIHLLQTSGSGEFFTAIPTYGPNGEVNLMGFRVITSNRMSVGNFILAESGLYKVEEEPVSVRMGYGIDVTVTGENVTAVSSDFDNNRFRIISEMFYHSYIATNNVGSAVKASFATVKAALQTP